MYQFLRNAPFNLDDAAMAWVQAQFESMSLTQRLGQLFNIMVMENSDHELAVINQLQPGAVTKFVGRDLEAEIDFMDRLLDCCPCPPLVSADLEGGMMSFAFGTSVPNQLGLAAINDAEVTEYCAAVQAREARALGINWAFAPVLDINQSFRSAIVGTRSYGDQPELVQAMALAHQRGLQQNGVAATAKHWPGEGFDDRDQHLVTTVNPQTPEQWRASFGQLYREMIDQGLMAVMSAHIALPEYMKLFTDDPEQWWRPASVNRVLNQQLLREEVGFNGLIVSDASVMAGVSSWADRATVVAETIANGCDMLLFCREPAEDFAFLQAAVRDGLVSEQRITEAVIRVLGMKAALNLHRQPATTNAALFEQPRDEQRLQALHRRCPTLVKDKSQFVPVAVEQHRRVLVFSPGVQNIFLPQPMPLQVPELLTAEGFEVTLFQAGMRIYVADYDWVLYLFADESSLLKSHIYIDWFRLGGCLDGAMARYWNELPTVMVSFGHPFYLYDAPRVPTYINAYSPTPALQKVVVDGLVGRCRFNDFSPVDAFCGSDQAR